MNAVDLFAGALSRGQLARIVGRRVRSSDAEAEALRRSVSRRYGGDLVAFLNRCHRSELESISGARGLGSGGHIGELRARLWRDGAGIEAGGAGCLGSPWQPIPVVLSGRLCHCGPELGPSAPAPGFPRPIPFPTPAPVAVEEPESVEELLDAASRLVGVRLSSRGADKGAFGNRAAALLGVRELGLAEPDWRGQVEIKTVPVARDSRGRWRVMEDPAVTMVGVDPMAKLRSVLWLARVSDCRDSPVLSWYYLEWSDRVGALVHRYLHQRPKGPAGTDARGWYLQKRFFAESGFLSSLNGRPEDLLESVLDERQRRGS